MEYAYKKLITLTHNQMRTKLEYYKTKQYHIQMIGQILIFHK